ncbi:MAG: hypothetical protein AB1489_39510 [Acidobacteriota bacterium]
MGTPEVVLKPANNRPLITNRNGYAPKPYSNRIDHQECVRQPDSFNGHRDRNFNPHDNPNKPGSRVLQEVEELRQEVNLLKKAIVKGDVVTDELKELIKAAKELLEETTTYMGELENSEPFWTALCKIEKLLNVIDVSED